MYKTELTKNPNQKKSQNLYNFAKCSWSQKGKTRMSATAFKKGQLDCKSR